MVLSTYVAVEIGLGMQSEKASRIILSQLLADRFLLPKIDFHVD